MHMRAILPPLIVVVSFAVTPATAASEAAPRAHVLDVYRGDRVIVEYSDEGRARLISAIESLRRLLGVPADLDERDEDVIDAFPVDPELKPDVIRLSQCYFTLGIIFLRGEDGEEDTYRRGKHWGLKALRMDPAFAASEDAEGFVAAVRSETNLDALYWACMNWVSVANFDRLAAIPAGIVGKTVAMLERCVELDPSYDCFGAYRVLGSIWGALPRMPFGTYRKNFERARSYFCFLVEEPALCCDLLERSIDPSCSTYLGNRRAFAEFYLVEQRRWSEAARVLRSVLDDPIGEMYPLYNARAKDDARALLEEVSRHL